jgi:hypothetical protein
VAGGGARAAARKAADDRYSRLGLNGRQSPSDAGPCQRPVKALRAGLELMKRRRLGRICDWCPQQFFAALGITMGTAGRCGDAVARQLERAPYSLHDLSQDTFTPSFKRSLKGRGPCLIQAIRLRPCGVATSREDHRSPRSSPAVLRQRWVGNGSGTGDWRRARSA